MAPNDTTQTPRRRASRYIVPVAVAGVAAATIGLVPALAASGDPDLPEITARELVEKIAASDTQSLSGTFKISTDLGLPSFAGLVGGGGSSSADPQDRLTELFTGTHTLRLAADGPERQRLTVLDGSDEYSLIHNGEDVWAYDSASKEAYHEKADGPKGGAEDGAKAGGTPGGVPATPKELADELLRVADGTTSITVGGTAKVAGRDAYQLVVKPKQSGSTVESVKVAVDAATGTPLKFTLRSASGGKPVVDAGFTKIDFGKPAASSFAAPSGARITEGFPEGEDKAPRGLGGLGDLTGLEDGDGVNVIGEGWTAIARLDTGTPAPEDSEIPAEARGFLDALGDKVSGKFGTGTVFSTKLVNALMTDDGKVYVGAVTKDALVDAANAGR
ncbi:DUF2092 domain-containing protein [Streptomyces sp. NBC_01216]|uniref:LolA family protein n=1 Tax=unclassified Streptomyces TaxID=2593676 RepID=UPI002E11DF22|nr:DUF2092 domain-containing protein [Streptomyces sp. NBC_01216]